MEVKGGVVTVLQLLTYKLSLELFSLSSVRIHIRMANFTRVSVFPGAAPNLNSSSCHTHMEAQARRVNVVTWLYKWTKCFPRWGLQYLAECRVCWSGKLVISFSSLTLFALLYTTACTSNLVWILTMVLQCVQIVKHNLYKDVSVYLYVFYKEQLQ